MAASKGQSDIFTPTRGWITEGNEGNWPQDIAVDIENMHVTAGGITLRRFGVDVLVTDQLLDLQATQVDGAISVGRWLNAFGQSLNAVVVQRGNTLFIYREMQPTTIALVATIDLGLYIVDPVSLDSMYATACAFTNIAGVLVVVNKYLEPFYLKWEVAGDDTDPTVQVYQIGVAMRVFEKFSNLTPGYRAKTIDHALEFDLRGAGWPFLCQCSQRQDGNGSPVLEDPLRKYAAVNQYYPALSELFYTMKVTSSEAPDNLDSFSAWDNQYSVVDNGTGPSGKFLTMAWDIDTMAILRGAASSYRGEQFDWIWLGLVPFSGVTITGDLIVDGPTIRRTTPIRPTSVAALNGHIIYAMQDYNSRWILAYSQTVQYLADIGKCYQQADPTAEEINDLVATDGGIMPIPDMGEPVRLVELDNSVIIICDNGVWELSGGADGSPFGATSYSVRKVSTFGTSHKQSVVALNNNVYFWTNDAIAVLAADQSGRYGLTRISDDTIKSWVEDHIAYGGGVSGVADAYNNRVLWTVPDSTSSTKAQHAASTVLVLDLNLKGFFRHRVSSSGNVYLLAPVVFPQKGSIVASIEVAVDADTVMVDADVVVVDGVDVLESASKEYNFLAVSLGTPDKLLFANFNNTDFKDWDRVTGGGGVEVSAYVEFPYRYGVSRAAGIQAPYVHSFFKLFRDNYPLAWEPGIVVCVEYPLAGINLACVGLEVHTLHLGHTLVDVPFGG